MNPLEENLKVWKQFGDFIKSLDDEGIESFIQYGKKNVENFGSEESWRETISEIRNS